MDNASPTHCLAQWVVDSQWNDIDLSVKTSVNATWINWLGCALGGANSPVSDQLMQALLPLSQGKTPIIGRAETLDCVNAALMHAFTSNILDFDDTHWSTGIHPAGTVASALVAWVSQNSHTLDRVVSGQEFLHAFLLGMEVECRIGLAVSPGHYERGWHITSTCGVFGAAVAVGKIMHLSPQQMAWALGHAATQSSGIVASLGTMAKSLNIAYAARNGLVAAQLAMHNITANDRILEARFGFNEVMGSRPLEQTLCAELGQKWIAADNTFKPYPCGFLLQPTLDACLTIPEAPIFTNETIVSITLTVHPLSQIRADRMHPVDGLESKLSLQHAVAVALLKGNAGVRSFTDDAANDPIIKACREKITIFTDDKLTTDEASLVIHLQDGQEITHAISGVQAPMSSFGLEHKFRDLVSFGSPHCNADELLSGLVTFSEITNVADLITRTIKTSS